MKAFAKWVAIGWSILCLVGMCWGLANVSQQNTALQSGSDAEKTGAVVGLGCGAGIWVVLWIVIAGPAMFIYLLSGKRETKQVTTPREAVSLCAICGKYHEGRPTFCPHCGSRQEFPP